MSKRSSAENWSALAKRVRERRLQLGIPTQRVAAELAEISHNTWQRLESGGSVGQRSLTAIARALQWPPGRPWLIVRGEDPEDGALTRPQEAADPSTGDAELPGLKATARAVASRIAILEAEVVAHDRNGNKQQALYAAHTAAYLRSFLAEFIGPLWLTWAQENA